jgi:glutamine amidotransferase
VVIVIVDYGMGNLGSIQNMLKKIGVEALLSSDKDVIKNADKLILPGVGAFDSGIENINRLGLIPILNEKVITKKTPILGICLGMQLFAKKSEEGTVPGLGWVDAEVIKFRTEQEKTNMKIPHIGWNYIRTTKESKLFNDMNGEERFYFVHSYHLEPKNKDDIIALTHYGYYFTSAIETGNIVGVQYHPEKSHKYGMKLLHNFSRLF